MNYRISSLSWSWSLVPGKTLWGTVIRTSGPCLELALTVGEPQKPFPLPVHPAPRGTLVNTAHQPWGQLACKISLVRGLLKKGGGLNSKSRLCESSAILIAKRAQVPGATFKLTGNMKEFYCLQKIKNKKFKWWIDPQWRFYIIMDCYVMKNNELERGIYRGF